MDTTLTMEEGYFLEIWGSSDHYEKMFTGPLPKPGDVCEIVCVNVEGDKSQFRLRVKAQ